MKLRGNHFAVAIWLMVCLPLTVDAAEGLQVTLHDSVELQSDRARLGDVAELSGDPMLIELARDAVVQELHDSATYHITTGDVRIAVANVVPVHRVHVTGSCAVVRSAERYSESAIAEAAMTHLREWIGVDVEASIIVKRVSGPLSVPALASMPATLEPEVLIRDPWGEVPYRVKLVRGEQELARALVVLESSATRMQPVATRDLKRGHELSLHDLRLEHQRVLSGDAMAAPSIEDLLGRIVTNRFRAGEAVTMSRTLEPALVHGGAQVTLIYQHDHFEVTVMGTALADGRLGEEIRIRQPNGHAVRARVTGHGQAVVNY